MLRLGDPDTPVVLTVSHNIEIAHRLYTLPGKCQNIHGHSMWVTLKIYAEHSDENGYALSSDGTLLEFGNLKKEFRRYLDAIWDHHLHLNQSDPWAGLVTLDGDLMEPLPGLQTWPLDPSTENIGRWIKNQCMLFVPNTEIAIIISETRTNGVEA